MIDWGAGRYERTAEGLMPAARRVVEIAEPAHGQDVLDLACGTGNAALLAAAAGARVTGIDLAPRLVEVAAERARAEGRDVAFVVGDAEALPFPGGAFDLVVSVFGIVFAREPARAAGEVMRVLRPGGRLVLSAWVPEGAIHDMVSTFGRAVAAAAGRGGSPPFPWSDPEAVAGLAGAGAGSVRAWDEAIAFTAASPDAYLAEADEHPMSVAGRALLERAGTAAEVRERALEVLRAGNEDPGGFRVTSRYRVIAITREDLPPT